MLSRDARCNSKESPLRDKFQHSIPNGENKKWFEITSTFQIANSKCLEGKSMGKGAEYEITKFKLAGSNCTKKKVREINCQYCKLGKRVGKMCTKICNRYITHMHCISRS